MEEESQKVCIGDIVFLRQAEGAGGAWICAEGHLGDNVYASSVNEEFHNGLWEVYVQNQYSAMNDLHEAQLLPHTQSNTDHGDSMLHQLEKAAANEQKLNERVYQSKIGTPVIYGDTIQLRHVQSKRFLSVSATELASQERENMRVLSILNGDNYSFLAIQPRIAMNMDGAMVISGFEACIRVSERPGEYLRCAKQVQEQKSGNKVNTNGRQEVNCSLEKSVWTVNVYQSWRDTKEYGKVINAGDPISLSDAETYSFLSVNYNDIDFENDDPNHVTNAILQPPVLVNERELNVGVGSLWRIEKKAVTKGGPIRLGQEKVLLCHLNTGMYLHSKKADGSMVGVKGRVRASEFSVNSSRESANQGGFLGNAFLEEASTITLSTNVAFGKQSGLFHVGLSNMNQATKDVTMLRTNADAAAACDFITSGVIYSKHKADIYFGIDAMRCLATFRNLAAEVSPDDAFDSANMVLASQAYKALCACMEQLCDFLDKKHIYAKQNKQQYGSHSFGISVNSKEALLSRQSMMKEQGVLDAIMDVLDDCVNRKFDSIKGASGGSSIFNASRLSSMSQPGLAPTSVGKGSGGAVKKAAQVGPPTATPDPFKDLPSKKQESPNFTKDNINEDDKQNKSKQQGGRKSVLQKVTSLWSSSNTSTTRAEAVKEDDSGSDSDSSSSSSSDDSDDSRVHQAKGSRWSAGPLGSVLGIPKKTPSKDEGEERAKLAQIQGAKNMFGVNSNQVGDNKDSKRSAPVLTRLGSSLGAFFKKKSATDHEEAAPEKSIYELTTSSTRRMSNFAGNAQKVSSTRSQISTSIVTPSALTRTQSVLNPHHDSEFGSKKRTSVTDELASMMLKSLFLCLESHHMNQLHISDRISVLLNHVGTQEDAVNCLNEIFRNNENILKTKIHQQEIDIFIRLLWQTPMNVSYLKLMQSTCTTPYGVDSTQRMVATALWGSDEKRPSIIGASPSSEDHRPLLPSVPGGASSENNGLTINVFMYYPGSEGNENMKVWGRRSAQQLDLYIPRDWSEVTEGIQGHNLLLNGLPDVAVNWRSPENAGHLSMLKLFGIRDFISFSVITSVHIKDYMTSVKLRELYKESQKAKDLSTGGNRRSSANLSGMMSRASATTRQTPKGSQEPVGVSLTDGYRIQAAEYLLFQLHLVADLCLDRNYVAIRIMEKCYPYDMLISILYMDDVQPHFKAPICRILRCLWIDREPQIAAVFPRLIRSSNNSEARGEHSDFSKHHKGSPYSFCLLQQTISDYFRVHFRAEECDELSIEMSEMAYMLINFGFYSKKEHLQDIVSPLMRGLDHTNKLVLSGKEMEQVEQDRIDREQRERELEERRMLEEGELREEDRSISLTGSLSSRRKSSSGNNNPLGAIEKLISFRQSSGDQKEGQQRGKHGLSDAKVVPSEGDVSEQDGPNETDDGDLSEYMVHTYKTARQMQAAKRKEEEEKRSSLQTVEGKFLAFTESVTGMVLVLLVVLLSVTVSILLTVAPEIFGDNIVFDVVDLTCSIFFMVELALRIYSVARVREGGVIPYFMEPLNLLDLALVVLDSVILLIGADDTSANAGRIARIARVIRFFRMLRILRVVRLMRMLANVKGDKDSYTLPTRYSEISDHAGRTFTTILNSLNLVYSRIQDNSLEIIIQSFQNWVELEREGQTVDVNQFIRKFMEGDDALGLLPQGFEAVLADLIMYDDDKLTDAALHLLMIHKNKKHILLRLSRDIQIVYSPKVENKLSEGKQNLQSMRRIAEMYEIWQALNSPEDLATAQQLSDLITATSNLMRKMNEDRTLTVKQEYIPDEEVQNLLRNLDAMNCFMTVLHALYDGGREKPPEAIRAIMEKCMVMVSYFVWRNPRNQVLASNHLYFFVDRIDDEISSWRVVKAILDGNSEIIKQCHKRCADEFAHKILASGRKPDYMEMFLGLTSNTAESNEGGMRPVHHNISRFLTSREWQARILLWCCAHDSAGYTKRQIEMDKYAQEDGKYISNEALSGDLRYHIALLEVLASCSLGPKLQAIYQFDDIIHAIIDVKTLFNVKIALCKCLEQVVLNQAAHFIGSEYMWQFFDYFRDYLQTMQDKMDRIFRRPHSSELVTTKSQIGLFLETGLTIVYIFFTVLDMSVFGEILYHDANIKHTQRVENDILASIRHLYSTIRVFLERFPTYLGPLIIERGNYALVALSKHSDSINYAYDGPDMIKASKRTQRASVTLADVQQLQLRHKFGDFTQSLQETDLVTHDESIDFFLNLPKISDGGDHDVRIEPFLAKIMSHMRGYIKSSRQSRTLTGNSEECAWILSTLRRLFERLLGISVEYTTDVDLHSININESCDVWREILSDCGLIPFCVDLIAVGIESTLTLEACNLLVVLLSKQGGALDVQMNIYKALKDSDSSLFFLQMKEILNELQLWYQKESEADSVQKFAGDEEVIILPDENVVFTIIQLLCAGDFLPAKNYMREQEDNTENVNVLQILCQILDFLSRRESPMFTHVAIIVVKTLRMVMHGPCRENQKYLVMNTEVLVSLNRLMRSSRPKNHALTLAWNKDIECLKECVVDLLRAAIEGFSRDSYVYDRIISSIELNVLSLLLLPSSDEDQDLIEYGFTHVEAKYMVFLSALEARGTEETLSSATLVKKEESISSVEVRWQKRTHKVYFHKPKILEDLSADYLHDFWDLDSTSQEEKLGSTLRKVKALHIEAKHQQLLKHYGLSYLWARRRNISMFLFALAGTLNILLLIYYERDYYHNILMPEPVVEAFSGLLFIQILVSLMMAVLYITVRMPSLYFSHIDNGHTKLEAFQETISDPLPIWYIVVFTCSILAYSTDLVFVVVFPLEFVVLDGTTQYLLKAVSLPFRQLVATFLILAIAIHIFSGLYFELFSYDLEHNHVRPIYDLWSSLRLALTYGLRGEYGVDHEFYVTIEERMWLDLAFYFIVLAILRHIFFAIIVETFGQLREEKNERDEKLHNSCFVCGIDRHEYEKLSPLVDFHDHRTKHHGLANYVEFIFSVLEQAELDDMGIEMYVRKCIKNLDITWLPVGLDKSYIGTTALTDGKGDDKSYEHDHFTQGMAAKRIHSDDFKQGDSGARGDDMADEGKDGADGADQRPSSPEASSSSANIPTKADALASRRDSRHTSMLGAGPGGLGVVGASQVKELMGTLSSINSQMHGLSTRLENIERQQAPTTVGVLGAGMGSGPGTAGSQRGAAMTAPVDASPYHGSPYRQPLPSAQSRQRLDQLRGPRADLDLSVFDTSTFATANSQEVSTTHSDGDSEGHQSAPSMNRGEEAKEPED